MSTQSFFFSPCKVPFKASRDQIGMSFARAVIQHSSILIVSHFFFIFPVSSFLFSLFLFFFIFQKHRVSGRWSGYDPDLSGVEQVWSRSVSEPYCPYRIPDCVHINFLLSSNQLTVVVSLLNSACFFKIIIESLGKVRELT